MSSAYEIRFTPFRYTSQEFRLMTISGKKYKMKLVVSIIVLATILGPPLNHPHYLPFLPSLLNFYSHLASSLLV